MKATSIIFPHQLFKDQPAIEKGQDIFLVEEELFFNQYQFHKKKLMLHRASMKFYESMLLKENFKVHYIDATEKHADIRALIPFLKEKKYGSIQICDPVDDWLMQRTVAACEQHNIQLHIHASPNFLNRMEDVKVFFDQKKTYFQTSFYIDQRKKRNILLTGSKEPEGGKWSYDAENRKRFPAKGKAPLINFPEENEFVYEARTYIENNFPANYGSTENFFYPVSADAAEKWLDEFIETRFIHFGVYEDAIVAEKHFLHHAVVSPLLNIGLLDPGKIISKALDAAPQNGVPINSLEGFIRQIMGWREFIRIVYEREGRFQRTKNYWNFSRKIPHSFWNGTTGIEPIDNTIRKILATGYCHHIERLMVLGNFMLLCEFDPDDVYRWFMEMFVDSYDWVMVPNTYGMVQFADGGLMTTKPYISGSNYILKMSNYKKADWCKTWDGLFWRFMNVHRDFFRKNPRLDMLIKSFDKMPQQKKDEHMQNAEAFLKKLDKT